MEGISFWLLGDSDIDDDDDDDDADGDKKDAMILVSLFVSARKQIKNKRRQIYFSRRISNIERISFWLLGDSGIDEDGDDDDEDDDDGDNDNDAVQWCPIMIMI